MKLIDFVRSTINIRAPNRDYINHKRAIERNVMLETFTPKEGVKITGVLEYGIIWEGEHPLKLLGLFRKDGRPYMLSVALKDGDFKYFIKSNGTWNTTTAEEFKSKFNELFLLPNVNDYVRISSNKMESSNLVEV